MSAKDERYADLFDGDDPDVDVSGESEGVVITISDGTESVDIEIEDESVTVDEMQSVVHEALEDEDVSQSLFFAGLQAAADINRALFFAGCVGVSVFTFGLFRTRKPKETTDEVA